MRPLLSSVRPTCVALLVFLAAAIASTAPGQEPTPAASPVPPPSAPPAASPVPPAPPAATVPPIVITPGVADQSVLEAYTAARTPLASLVVGTAPASTGDSAANAADFLRAVAAAAAIRPAAKGGTFPQIVLTANPPKAAAATATTNSPVAPATPPLATVTLSYEASRADDNVWVQPLGGGTLSVVDEHYQTVTSTDGVLLTIGATGSVTFSFQAPATPDTYQVLTRLDNVTTTLNFLVPDPNP